MSNEYNFESLEEIVIPFKYNDENYVLCEASGEVARRYRNKMLEGASVEESTGRFRITNPKGMGDLQSLLLAGCVFKLVGEENRREAVKEENILAWPERLLKRLFATAQEISELLEKPNEENPTQPAE